MESFVQVTMDTDTDDSFWAQPLGMSAALQESMEKMKKSYCSVMNCHINSSHNPDLSFFRLPSNPTRAAKWLERIHRVKSITKKMLVCERHFERRYININESRKRLVAHAVPSLRLPTAVALECTPDVDPAGAAAAADAADDDDTAAGSGAQIMEPETKKRTNANARMSITSAKHIIRTFTGKSTKNPDDAEKYVARMIKLQQKFRQPCEGEKISDSFKFFALKLYSSYPKTYKVMRPVLSLPSISELYRLFIPTSTDVCENLMIALKIKVDDMTEPQKQCAVCIGTMELKEHLYYDTRKDEVFGFHEVDGVQRLKPADTALVVMVRGLFDKWTQAISFSLLAQYEDYKDVKIYIYKIIHKLFDIGLNVRVFISDIESDFIGISKENKINSKSPFFFLDGRKVYYMYDPAHLLRVIRENLMTHDFHFNGMVAKWEHITACYDHDHKSSLRLAPRLTCYHIIHTHLQSARERIKLATQVFSKTTAAAVSAYADMTVIDEAAKQTVEWIMMINQLFNMLNFNNLDFDGETKTSFTGEESEIKFLNEIISMLKKLRLISTENMRDETHNAKFISRLQVTLKVVQTLQQELKDVFTEVPIIGLNRDCLDIFFEKISLQYGRYPTSRQIKLMMGKVPIFNIFQWKSKKTTESIDHFLKMAMINSNMNIYQYVIPKVDSIDAGYDLPLNIGLNAVEVFNESALHRMAAYLLYEGYQRHNNCEAMKSYAFENSNSTTVILTIKAKNQLDNTVIVMVPTEFVEFVESMELTLKLYIETDYQQNPLRGLKDHLFAESITFKMPCECFPLDYIKVLYIRYRFHILIKYNNREFQNMKDSRKYFMVNDL